MKTIIKVDRVSSVQEAKELQDLGVNIISVALESDIRFQDDRYVSEDLACEISKVLRSTKYCASLSLTEQKYSKLESCNFDYLQISGMKTSSSSVMNYFNKINAGLIYSGIEVSYDEDPIWIQDLLQNEINSNTSFFQIDLLPDMTRAWQFLKEECPKYQEELQIEDIDKLASQFPLIIGLDFTPENTREILNYLPNIKGINLRLGENSLRDDLYCIDFNSLVNVLSVLQKI